MQAIRSLPRYSPTAFISIGRSLKYHRPRGILGAGAEEPNALIGVSRGPGRFTPNLRATQIELYEGLKASSQNRWPSLKFDVGAVSDLLSPLFGAGFYYRMFMGPNVFGKNWAWRHVYEPMIRRAAGLGALRARPTPTAISALSIIATCSSSAPARRGSRRRWPRAKAARGSSSVMNTRRRAARSSPRRALKLGNWRGRAGSRTPSKRCAMRPTYD